MTTITNTFDKLKEIEEVISLFHDDMTLMFGGFGGLIPSIFNTGDIRKRSYKFKFNRK